MFRNFFAACLLSIVTQPVLAADVLPECSRAGPGLTFCAGADFTRIDKGQNKGISYWLHPKGFISKVLAEKGGALTVTQQAIEARIIEMIDARAGAVGQNFEFIDLDSRSINGAPFGTLTYRLAGPNKSTTVLHSYAALNGVLVQVLSQMSPRSTAEDAAALRHAHFAAVGALKPIGPEAEL